MIRFGSASRGADAVQRATELVDAHAQHAGVERHVDTGHQDEGALAAGDLATSLHLLLEGLQAAHRPGDRVLRAAQVEVHDLQEFPGALGDLGDEAGDLGVGQVDLRRADCGQPVVGPAHLVAGHDVASCCRGGTPPRAAPPARRPRTRTPARCTFTDGVAAGDGALDEGALLAHLGDLGGRHGGHRHLGELRQVQHALGVLVVHAAGDQGWSGCRAPRAAPRSRGSRG